MTTERDAVPPPFLQHGHTPTSSKPAPMIEKIRIIHLAGTTGEYRRSISQIFVYCEATTPDGKPVKITPRYLESLMRFGKLPYMDVGLHSKQNDELDELATRLYRAAAENLGKTEALALVQSITAGIASIALFPDVILDRSEEIVAA
ncbi:MAG: hypothetical protein KA537_00895 [Candidatus Moranbacteria bacterium]|nr:hypothetical protein [Candidatus Moranbacteria bacterium]